MSFDSVLAENIKPVGKMKQALCALDPKDKIAAEKAIENLTISNSAIAKTLSKLTSLPVSSDNVWKYRVNKGLKS